MSEYTKRHGPPSASPNASRRDFLGACSSAAAIACGASGAWATQQLKQFEASILTDADDKPLSADSLKPGTEYIFHYPFNGTPCFLINLGSGANNGIELKQADGQPYKWDGGVGPDNAIVAFSAICAHKLSHPSPLVSFIGYRERPVGFLNRETNEIQQRAGVIQCCSEHSIYDPANGAKVVSGPAPQPLASIALAVSDGNLVATGVYGGNLFEPYFEKFGNRLMLEHRGDKYKQTVGKTTRVIAGADYSRNRIQCG